MEDKLWNRDLTKSLFATLLCLAPPALVSLLGVEDEIPFLGIIFSIYSLLCFCWVGYITLHLSESYKIDLSSGISLDNNEYFYINGRYVPVNEYKTLFPLVDTSNWIRCSRMKFKAYEKYPFFNKRRYIEIIEFVEIASPSGDKRTSKA